MPTLSHDQIKESVKKVFRLNSVTPKTEDSVIDSVKKDHDLGPMTPEKERDIEIQVPKILDELLEEGSIEQVLGNLYRGISESEDASEDDSNA